MAAAAIILSSMKRMGGFEKINLENPSRDGNESAKINYVVSTAYR